MGAQHWEVVGGADKGGILVRGGQATSSEQLSERLATGALVLELELAGDRLHYEKVKGAGPEKGWVSVSLKDKALLVKAAAADPEVPQAAAPEAPKPEEAKAAAPTGPVPLRDNDYYVTLGVLFKKPGADPETEKILKLSRKVGAVVHTTGKIWKSPKGGFWAELDVSQGDSGAGEKPGYVMIDASGFGTPGPCLQKATAEDGQPWLLRAPTPQGAKPWDSSAASEKEFVAFPHTTVGELKIVLGMLFSSSAASVNVSAPSSAKAAEADSATLSEAGFTNGAVVKFELRGAKGMRLKIMSPLEEGKLLCWLDIKEDWSVKQVKALLCDLTSLKRGSVLMAKGQMGTRVSEDAKLDEQAMVVDCGYKDGDEIAFIYLGDIESDLAAFVSKN